MDKLTPEKIETAKQDTQSNKIADEDLKEVVGGFDKYAWYDETENLITGKMETCGYYERYEPHILKGYPEGICHSCKHWDRENPYLDGSLYACYCFHPANKKKNG